MKEIIVSDKMQTNYTYRLIDPIGKNFQHDFNPELTPEEMLNLGVFAGKYLNDCQNEFPQDWFFTCEIEPDCKRY